MAYARGIPPSTLFDWAMSTSRIKVSYVRCVTHLECEVPHFCMNVKELPLRSETSNSHCMMVTILMVRSLFHILAKPGAQRGLSFWHATDTTYIF